LSILSTQYVDCEKFSIAIKQKYAFFVLLFSFIRYLKNVNFTIKDVINAVMRYSDFDPLCNIIKSRINEKDENN